MTQRERLMAAIEAVQDKDWDNEEQPYLLIDRGDAEEWADELMKHGVRVVDLDTLARATRRFLWEQDGEPDEGDYHDAGLLLAALDAEGER